MLAHQALFSALPTNDARAAEIVDGQYWHGEESREEEASEIAGAKGARGARRINKLDTA
jgi:hypothetical protein